MNALPVRPRYAVMRCIDGIWHTLAPRGKPPIFDYYPLAAVIAKVYGGEARPTGGNST